MRKNRLTLLCASAAGLLLVALVSSLSWSSPFLPVVIIGLCAIILPFGLALYTDNRRTAFMLLGLAGLAVFAGIGMLIEQQIRLATFTETCKEFQGTVVAEDFQYVCLNSNQEKGITSVDMLSGVVMNWGIVWHAATLLISLAYAVYRFVRLWRTRMVE